MALTGHTYQAIADGSGTPTGQTVYKLVAEALEQQQVETVDERCQLELSRLDLLQYGIKQGQPSSFTQVCTRRRHHGLRRWSGGHCVITS